MEIISCDLCNAYGDGMEEARHQTTEEVDRFAGSLFNNPTRIYYCDDCAAVVRAAPWVGPESSLERIEGELS